MTLHLSFTKTININIPEDIHIQNPAVLKLGSQRLIPCCFSLGDHHFLQQIGVGKNPNVGWNTQTNKRINRELMYARIKTKHRCTTYEDKSVTEMHHLIRMHLIGDPSAPGNLKGKQWTEYIPGSTSSSFKASTRMISWNMKAVLVSESWNRISG